MFSRLTADRFEEKEPTGSPGPGTYDLPTATDDRSATIACSDKRFGECFSIGTTENVGPGTYVSPPEEPQTKKILQPRCSLTRSASGGLTRSSSGKIGGKAPAAAATKENRPPTPRGGNTSGNIAKSSPRTSISKPTNSGATGIAKPDLDKRKEQIEQIKAAAARTAIAETEVQRLQQDLEEAKKSLNDMTEHSSGLQETLEEKNAQFAEIQISLNGFENQVEKQKMEIGDVNALLHDAETDIETKTRKITETQDALQKAQKDVADRTVEINEIQAQRTVAEKRAQDAMAELEKVRQALAKAEDDLVEMRKVESRLSEQTLLAEQFAIEVSELRGRLYTNEEAQAMLTQENSNLRAKHQTESEEAANLREDLDVKHERCTALQKQVSDTLEQFTSLRNEVDSAFAERDRLCTDAQSLRADLEAQRGRCDEFQSQIKQSEKTRETLEEKLSAQTTLNDIAAVAERDALRQEAQSVRADLDAKHDRCNELENLVEQAESKREKLLEMLETNKKKVEIEQRKQKNDNIALASERDFLREEASSLRTLIDEEKQRSAHMQIDLKKEKTKYTALQEQLDKNNGDMGAQQREAEIAKETLETERSKNTALNESLETEVKNVENEREALRQQAEIAKETLETERSKNTALKESLEAEIKNVENEREALRQQAEISKETLETERSKSMALKESLEAEIKNVENERESLRQQAEIAKETLETERSKSTPLKESLEAEVKNAEHEREALRQQAAIANEEVETERANSIALKNSFESERKNTENEKDSLRQQVQSAMRDLDAERLKGDALKSEVEAQIEVLQVEKDSLLQQVAEQNTANALLTSEFEELRVQSANEVATLKSELSVVTAAEQNKKSDVEGAAHEEEQLRKEVETLRFAKKQADLFCRDKDRAEEALKQAKMDIEHWRQKFHCVDVDSTRLERLEEDVQVSLRETAELRTQNRQLLRSVQQLSKDWEQAETENRALSNQVGNMETELERASDANARLIGHTNQKQKIRYTVALKEENAQLREDLKKTRQRTAQLELARKGDGIFDALASFSAFSAASVAPTGVVSEVRCPTTPGPARTPRKSSTAARPVSNGRTPARTPGRGQRQQDEHCLKLGDYERRCEIQERSLERMNVDFQHFLALIERVVPAADERSDDYSTTNVADLLERLREVAEVAHGQRSGAAAGPGWNSMPEFVIPPHLANMEVGTASPVIEASEEFLEVAGELADGRRHLKMDLAGDDYIET